MRLLGVVLVALSSLASAQFSPRERLGLTNALSAASLVDADLNFAKRGQTVAFSHALSNLCMDKPIEGTESLMALHAKAEPSFSNLLATVSEEGFGDSPSAGMGGEAAQIPATIALPESLRGPVSDLVQGIYESNLAVREATSKLTPEEKRLLIEALPQWATLGTEIKFDFVKQEKPTLAQLYSLLNKVELAKIRASAIKLARRIEQALPALRQAANAGWKGTLTFTVTGVVVEISGSDDDLHEAKNTNLCIDLGGRNRYTGRYGAGIGYTSVLIDFGRETVCEVPDASCGAGVLGIGFAYFGGTRPDLNGKGINFGAGLAGVGVTQVEQSFRMESRNLGQGFGMAGVGLLIGSKGTDSMKIGYLGQGAAMLGGFGWLFDPSGNDRYRTGGLVPDGQSPKQFLSRSQGYAGILPGGMGLLTDNDGDDLYDSGSEAQGFGANAGLGSLYDLNGNDVYIANRAGQSCAVEGGYSALFDLSGDDIYAVRQGECHAYARQRSVAFLVDREGNDLVGAHQSEPGFAQEGSLGVFIDADGSDRYAGPAGLSVQFGGRTGVGLFVQLGGDDRSIDGPAPHTALVRDGTGVALSDGESVAIPEIKPIRAGSLTATETEIDVLWEQVQTQGSKSLAAMRQLVGIGVPALKPFFVGHSRGASTLVCRTVATIVGNQSTAQKLLADSADKAPVNERSPYFEIATYTNTAVLKNLVPTGLENEFTSRATVAYVAKIEAKEFLQTISGLVISGDAVTSQEAVIALTKLADERLLPTMESLLTSNDLLIRKQVIGFIARYPQRAETLSKTLVTRQDEKSQLNGIEMLGAMGTPESLRLAGSGLNSQYRSVRIKAMTTLSGRVPEAYRSRIVELMQDPNSVVAAVARGVNLGR